MMGDQQQKLALLSWRCTCIWLGLGDEEGGESAGDERASSVVTYQQGEQTEQ